MPPGVLISAASRSRSTAVTSAVTAPSQASSWLSGRSRPAVSASIVRPFAALRGGKTMRPARVVPATLRACGAGAPVGVSGDGRRGHSVRFEGSRPALRAATAREAAMRLTAPRHRRARVVRRPRDRVPAERGPGDGRSAAPRSPAVTLSAKPALAPESSVSVGWALAKSGYSQPVQVTSAHDGSGRFFIVTKSGKVWVYENGVTLPTPYLDLHLAGVDGRRAGAAQHRVPAVVHHLAAGLRRVHRLERDAGAAPRTRATVVRRRTRSPTPGTIAAAGPAPDVHQPQRRAARVRPGQVALHRHR